MLSRERKTKNVPETFCVQHWPVTHAASDVTHMDQVEMTFWIRPFAIDIIDFEADVRRTSIRLYRRQIRADDLGVGMCFAKITVV